LLGVALGVVLMPQLAAAKASNDLARYSAMLDWGLRLVVLLAAVTATREDRAREFAIMRAVGASAGLLRQVQRAELLGVGLLAGFLASVVAAAVGWALARFVFEFDWSVSLWVPLLGALAGAVLALAAGWWGLRDVLRRPVVETLRRAAQ